MVDMPLRTTITASWLAAKRMAQEAGDQSGWRAFISSATSWGTEASRPPFTGSMTTTFFPWRTTVS